MDDPINPAAPVIRNFGIGNHDSGCEKVSGVRSQVLGSRKVNDLDGYGCVGFPRYSDFLTRDT